MGEVIKTPEELREDMRQESEIYAQIKALLKQGELSIPEIQERFPHLGRKRIRSMMQHWKVKVIPRTRAKYSLKGNL